jgi:cell wall-associated NlpC family hydrolase
MGSAAWAWVWKPSGSERLSTTARARAGRSRVASRDGRYRPGDHLIVRRPRGYDHHGIYISDDRVIQFGSGITLTDKSRTAVSAVTLAEFAQGGTATVARHGYESVLDTGS